jgi:hypothetical protein
MIILRRIFSASVISLRLSADEQMLYFGSLDKYCIWWSLPTRQICFKNSFPSMMMLMKDQIFLLHLLYV